MNRIEGRLGSACPPPNAAEQIRVLGCSGALAQGCHTTSFLVGRRLLVDAGTGVGLLTLDEMTAIDDVVLTHCHLDHVAALPLMLDAVGAKRGRPLRVHGLADTLDALRAHVFNGVLWPDFSRLPSADHPFMTFHPLQTGDVLELAGWRVEALPALHTVPAVGYALAPSRRSAFWVFSGDTAVHVPFWHRINQLNVQALVIETAFSQREAALADISRHLCPSTLNEALQLMDAEARYPIYITHAKPAEADLILQDIQAWDSASGQTASHRSIQLLTSGQVFGWEGD